MKKPIFVAITIINTILVIVLLVWVYQLGQPKEVSLTNLMQNNSEEASQKEPIDYKQLLADATSEQEKAQVIQRAPATQEMAEQIAPLLESQSPEPLTLGWVQLQNTAFLQLSKTMDNADELFAMAEARLKNGNLPISVRDQALRVAAEWTVQAIQKDATNQAALLEELNKLLRYAEHKQGTSLPGTALQILSYVEKNVPDSISNDEFEAAVESVLSADSLNEYNRLAALEIIVQYKLDSFAAFVRDNLSNPHSDDALVAALFAIAEVGTPEDITMLKQLPVNTAPLERTKLKAIELLQKTTAEESEVLQQ